MTKQLNYNLDVNLILIITVVTINMSNSKSIQNFMTVEVHVGNDRKGIFDSEMDSS